MSNIYSQFNEKQLQAITTQGDSTLVVAGAGSGKTSVLTYRIVYLVTDLGLSPNRILGFTFTNKAANEMKNRISNLIPNFAFPFIGTFHGICLKILRQDINHLNLANIKSNFSIIDGDDQLTFIKEVYTLNRLDKNDLSYKNCLSYISQLKFENTTLEDLSDNLDEILVNDYSNRKRPIIEMCFKKYVSYLQDNNMLDFDDLIKCTLKLLKHNKEVLNKWQDRFDYILVDEFQDTNYDQFEIIKLLSKNKDNVFAVGDPDQMIYSWRGAYDNIFSEFREVFKDVDTIILDKNYRSTKKILSTANKLIQNNQNRIKKDLYTDSQTLGDVVYYNAPSQETESKYVINKIQKYKEMGYDYKDMAILYRTNSCSRNIEQFLTFSSIPYHIYGGFKFYQRKEIKDIISYLKLISNGDDIALSRIYNTPKRGLSENAFLKIKEFAIENDLSTFDALNCCDNVDITKKAIEAAKNLHALILKFRNKNYESIVNMVEDIIEQTGYHEMLSESEEESRMENINELKTAIHQFESKNETSSLDLYLQEISLLTSSDEESKKDKNFVSLMTIHISKGLEFKIVFIIEFNEGIFPSYKSIEENNVEEERRIAYVAITRAREHLHILSSEGIGFFDSKKVNRVPSRFYDELSNDEVVVIHGSTSSSNLKNANQSFFSPALNSKINYKQNYYSKNINYEIGDWVMHNMFGEGVVVDVDSSTVQIAFKNKAHGTKRILKNHKSINRKLS